GRPIFSTCWSRSRRTGWPAGRDGRPPRWRRRLPWVRGLRPFEAVSREKAKAAAILMDVVLVTGANGFVGRACLATLGSHEVAICGVTRQGGNRSHGQRLIWHVADLLAPGEIARLMDAVRPQYLLHLAWETAHGEYWSSLANHQWADASIQLFRSFAR